METDPASTVSEAEGAYLRLAFARRRMVNLTIAGTVFIGTVGVAAFSAFMIRLFIAKPTGLNGLVALLSLAAALAIALLTLVLLRMQRPGREMRVTPLAGRFHHRLNPHGEHRVAQHYVGDTPVDIPDHWYRTLSQGAAPMRFRAAMAMKTAREPEGLPFQIVGAENGLSIDYEHAKGLSPFPTITHWMVIGLILTGLAAFVLIATALSFEPYDAGSAWTDLAMASAGGGALFAFFGLAGLCLRQRRRAKAFRKRLQAAYNEIGVHFVV
jgi:hypothetical protein